MEIKEAYLPGYSSNASDFMSLRTAQSHAGFLLSSVRPGQRVLDCGCGPGTITIELARLVSPGQVIGFDRESSQIARAREAATRHGITNVRFEVGSVYELPFADESFEIVFGHALYEHLREPLSGLAEAHRVLVPGGLVALRSPDWGGFLVSPLTGSLAAAIEYYQNLQTQSGGDVQFGRKLKALLRRAGFQALEFSASYECYRTLESIGEYLAQAIERSSTPDANQSDKEQIESYAAALRKWYSCDDGVFAQSWCEILGRK